MNQSSPYYAYGHPLHLLQKKKETSEKECSRNKTNLQIFEKQIILMYLIL